MKKYIIAFTFACAGLSGCVDLTQEPKSFLTPENFEYTEPNTISMAGGLYKTLWGGNWGFNCRPQILGLGADDIVGGSVNKRHYVADQLTIDGSQFDGDTKLIWEIFYSVIRESSQLIEGLEPSESMPQEKKLQYLGEAYFMRAFCYFHLVRWFGDVPGYKDSKCEVDIMGNTTAVRNKVEDIYDKIIIPDLKIAEEYLPHRGRTAAKNSTTNKWAAKACLSDVYLTMAGWPLKRTEAYALARDKAKEIIDEGGFSLLPHYEDLWKEATKSEDTEHIFALNHSVVEQASNYGISYMTEIEEGGWSDYLADSCFYERYPDDERKAFNFIKEFQVGKRKIDFRNSEMRSPAINKYRDYGTTSAQSAGITPIYRYADVLLMYAEAQNKADHGPNALAYKCINDVRQRAMGGIANDLATGLNEADFDQAVFDERGWEFFAEFKRWFQLVRTEKVWEANQFNPRVRNALVQFGINKGNRNVYLMPLPEEEQQICNFEPNPR